MHTCGGYRTIEYIRCVFVIFDAGHSIVAIDAVFPLPFPIEIFSVQRGCFSFFVFFPYNFVLLPRLRFTSDRSCVLFCFFFLFLFCFVFSMSTHVLVAGKLLSLFSVDDDGATEQTIINVTRLRRASLTKSLSISLVNYFNCILRYYCVFFSTVAFRFHIQSSVFLGFWFFFGKVLCI